MIPDEEQNSTTDSEESSPQSPQAEKRQYHNFLERNRRNVLKYSFRMLSGSIPSLAKKKLIRNRNKVSRAKVLKRAIDYIGRTERKKPAIQQNIRELERDNAFFREQSIALQQAEEEGDRDKLEAIFEKIDEVAAKTYNIGSRSEDEYEDSSDSESENGQNGEAVGPEDPRIDWSSYNDQYMQDIQEIESDNAFLHEQSLALTKANKERDGDKMKAICRNIDEVTAKPYDSLVSDTEDDDEDTEDSESDNEAVGPENPRMEWSSDNGQDNNEPEQGWSVNASEDSESSESNESSEVESSSEYE